MKTYGQPKQAYENASTNKSSIQTTLKNPPTNIWTWQIKRKKYFSCKQTNQDLENIPMNTKTKTENENETETEIEGVNVKRDEKTKSEYKRR